jgi:hypothetical protein
MPGTVLLHDAFDHEFNDLPEDVHDEVLVRARLLGVFGPNRGQPRVDTLKGSMRFDAADGM